jgi:acyl carrier protein
MAVRVMHIQQEIRDCVCEGFLFGQHGLQDDDSFLELGVVDSTGVLELVLLAEETFGIVVDDEEILPENFDSICGLTRYVAAKLGCPCEARP